MGPDPKKIFGENVRRVRTASGMSQEDLAFQAGLTRSYKSDVEGGERNPTVKTIAKISAALNISSAQLVDGIPDRATEFD